jgi:hypothetical protein
MNEDLAERMAKAARDQKRYREGPEYRLRKINNNRRLKGHPQITSLNEIDPSRQRLPLPTP